MRTELLTFIKGLNVGTLAVSNDSPFEDGGVPLYLKNARTIYVDRAQTTSEPIVQTFQGVNVSNETTTVSVYISLDAKQLIANYDTIMSTLKTARDIEFAGIHRREVNVETEYEEDMLVTRLDFRFTKLLS